MAARPERLPKGRHSLSQEFVADSQQRRLLRAMADAVAENGYAATTIADVVSRAGVSRKTFYEHFDGKQECFLALYDAGIAFLQTRVSAAIGAGPQAGDRLLAGMNALLAVLEERPAVFRAIVLESHAAGPAVAERRRAMMRTFAELYQEINEQARIADPAIPPLTDEIALGVVGGILEILCDRVTSAPSKDLASLAEPLSAFVLRSAAAPAPPGERA